MADRPQTAQHAAKTRPIVHHRRTLSQEKEGITICATIHCPSIETFRLFDRVLLLQHGRAVYHGDNGAPVIDYFQTNFPDVRLCLLPGFHACCNLQRHTSIVTV